jgi:hypothetical protein
MLVCSAIVGVLIAEGQRWLCFAQDDFEVVEVDGSAYKVFRYGFPVSVVEASLVVGDRASPPPQQARSRRSSNAILCFAASFALASMAQRLRKRPHI